MATQVADRPVTASSRFERLRQVMVLAAVAGPPALAGALIPARSWLTSPNVALVMVALVVAIAALGGRMVGILAAVSAAVWFDYFHTQPYYSFAIERHQDVTTVVLVLAVGAVVGDLTTRSRKHQFSAEVKSADLDRIHAIAGMLASGEDAGLVVLTVATELRSLLSLRDCRFERDLRLDERPRARIEPDGTVILGMFKWGAETLGLPSKGVRLPATFGGQSYGTFVLHPTPGREVSLERRVAAVALAEQAGAALAGELRSPGRK